MRCRASYVSYIATSYEYQSEKTTHRDLGIIFSVTLQWRPHYDNSTAKAYKILGLLHRIFKNSISYEAKKLLYISLVRSCLLYCSPLWRPHLIQDILLLEKVQRRATKVILNDYTSDYKSRLIKLQLLPLMYMYDLSDILFFIKSAKTPNNSFDIMNYVSFVRGATRSSDTKLVHRTTDNCITSNSYFYRIPRLWNALPEIDLTLSINTMKTKLNTFLWNHFMHNFDPNNNCTLKFLCPCCNCTRHPLTPNFRSL